MGRFAALLICSLSLAANAEDAVRVWKQADGQTFEGRFIREVDGDVSFLTKDGKLLHRHFEKLSEDDQKLIRDIEATKTLDKTIPPAGAPPEEPLDQKTDDSSNRPDLANDQKSSQAKRAVAIPRDWVDRNGKQTPNAKFVRIHEKKVILSRAGRLTPPIPFIALSVPDQQYIRDFLVARGEESQLSGLSSEFDQPSIAADGGVFTVPDAPFVPAPVVDQGPRIAGRTPLYQGRGAGQQADATSASPEGESPNEAAVTVETSIAPAVEPDVAPAIAPEASSDHFNRLHEAVRDRFAGLHAIVQRLTAGAVIVLLVILALGMLIGSVVGAIILRAAIALVNGMTGGSRSRDAVPEPTFGEGMGIVFLIMLVNFVVGIATGFAIGIGGTVAGMSESDLRMASQFVSLPLSFLVMATMFSSMLPTSFFRGILVTICYIGVSFVVGFILVAGAVALFGLKLKMG